MKLDGRRESTNVDDRRGKGGKTMLGGLGIGGIIVAALFAWLTGGSPLDVLQNVDLTQVSQTASGDEGTEYTPTEEEAELEHFVKQVLASTEDVWDDQFKRMGKTYEAPTLVLFKGSVQSGCGGASSSSGPFYCSADQSVYIDLSFFMDMKKTLGADGDFAYAYVVAHEVGHHVQYLLGTLGQAHQQMSQMSEKEANKISVMLELQADNYAGVWAHHENKMFGSLEDGDLEEAIKTASVIGDDYLQKQAQGYAVPESFNHGTSAQRMRWLKKGFDTGDIKKGNTFDYQYSQL